MFINPRVALQEQWISGLVDEEKQVQPNAIDFTLDKVFTINESNIFAISEGGKQMRGGIEHHPITERSTGAQYWKLHQGVYDGMSNVYVKVPDGVAVMLIIRSTFNRNGIFITSGLYDSGFEGHIGFAIHNRCGQANIGVGTRIGQVIFVESENALRYAGGWNHEEGTHYSEK